MTDKVYMTRIDFIKKLFHFFKGDNIDGALLETYDKILTVNYAVNWDGLYYDIIDNAEKKVIPLPKFIKEKLPLFKFENIYKKSKYDGGLIRVVFKNGNVYEFTIDCSKGTNIDGIIDEKKKDLKTVTYYPKGCFFMNNKLHFKTFIPERSLMDKKEKDAEIKRQEEELKKQICILFNS